jgi:truncated hemoglobin YjbI
MGRRAPRHSSPWFTRFYELVPQDDLLAPMFTGMNAHLASVASWVGEVFGGPADYTAHGGGYENMLAHHIDKAITTEQRRRWVNLLITAADEVGLPGDPEFRSAFVAYLEWGTCIAKENSSREPRRCRMPRCRGGAGVWRHRGRDETPLS